MNNVAPSMRRLLSLNAWFMRLFKGLNLHFFRPDLWFEQVLTYSGGESTHRQQ